MKLEPSKRIFKQYSLGFIVQDGRILLGKRKVSWGRGLYNGFGGKVNPGESFENSLKREFLEESGIEVTEYEKKGILFIRDDLKQTTTELHIFEVLGYSGKAVETKEMLPEWLPLDKIPLDRLMIGTDLWLEHFLNKRTFIGSIEAKSGKILYDNIKIVNGLGEEICTMKNRYIMSLRQ